MMGPGSGRVISPKGNWDADTTLDTFIDPTHKAWKMDLIRNTFIPFEANLIMSTPISLRGEEDKRCWVLRSDGLFRVKDLYKQAMSNVEDSSCSSGPDPLWAKIWKLKVPPKIREFTWRACWDIIPHGLNLCRKGISNFIACPRCGKDGSLFHIIKCPRALEVWQTVGFEFPSIVWHSFKDLLDWVWSAKGIKSAETFVVLCWQIWKARNDLIFNNNQSHPSLCAGKTGDWLQEYQRALRFGFLEDKPKRAEARWQTPPEGSIKINCDASFSPEGDKHELGFIARDHQRVFIAAGARTVWGADFAETVEARALFWALTIADLLWIEDGRR